MSHTPYRFLFGKIGVAVVLMLGDGYRSSMQQKERKTEEEVGGLCERRSEREGTVRRGVRPSCMEATIVTYRPHIELG